MRPSDRLNYTATNQAGESQLCNGAACFYQHMARLPSFSFECRPYDTPNSILSGEDYLKWMRLCLDNRLLPAASEFWVTEEKNIARIPGRGEPKSRIYAGLCCYRWAECVSPLCWTVLRILEAMPLDFFQALHYGLGKFVPYSGHSFSSICSCGIYGPVAHRDDLVYSVMLKRYFQSCQDGQENSTPSGTYAAVDEMVTRVGAHMPVGFTSVLEERWTPLYRIEPTKENLLGCYDKVK